MLLIIGLLLTTLILVAMLRLRVNGRAKSAHLGRMSERWVAAQQSARPS
jgi:hypothetical protein